MNDEALVPIRVDTVTPTSTDEPYPEATSHDSAVFDCHVVFVHGFALIDMVGVVSYVAKLRPLTVIISPAVEAPF